MTVNLAGGNLLLKDHTSGVWRTSEYVPVNNGADYNGLTPDVFVSSSGTNSGSASTEQTAWATLAYAYSIAPAGSVIGVVDDLNEVLDLSTLEANPGVSISNHTQTVGKSIFTIINGRLASGIENVDCWHEFRWIYFKSPSGTHSPYAKYCKFISCFFSVTGASANGNNPMLELGNYQLYEACGFMGDSGRYVAIMYQASNTVVRWSVGRAEADVWTGNPGDPNATFQTYSSDDCTLVQCVVADSLRQGASAEPLGDFAQTSNVAPGSSGVEYIECVAKNSYYYSYQIEGDELNNGHLQDCISIESVLGFGAVGKNGNGNVDATANGGHIINATDTALVAFNSASLVATGVNIQGSGQDNNGASVSGITHDVITPAAIIASMERIGVAGTYRGETGWDVKQTGVPLFPLPFEDSIRSIFAAYSNRGYCAVGKTLTSYLSESV